MLASNRNLLIDIIQEANVKALNGEALLEIQVLSSIGYVDYMGELYDTSERDEMMELQRKVLNTYSDTLIDTENVVELETKDLLVLKEIFSVAETISHNGRIKVECKLNFNNNSILVIINNTSRTVGLLVDYAMIDTYLDLGIEEVEQYATFQDLLKALMQIETKGLE